MKDKENKPFHVVNITLNLVHGKRLAWQERKATSFTVSPLAAGNPHLGYRRAEKYGNRDQPRYGHGDLWSGREPQHGLPFVAALGLAHDVVQRPFGLVAR